MQFGFSEIMNFLPANQKNKLHIVKYFKFSIIGINYNEGKSTRSF